MGVRCEGWSGGGRCYVLDCTTACVCSEVPEAMLVRAQAASNWRDGLGRQERERERARGEEEEIRHKVRREG